MPLARYCNNCGRIYLVPEEEGKERKRALKSPYCVGTCKIAMENRIRAFKRKFVAVVKKIQEAVLTSTT